MLIYSLQNVRLLFNAQHDCERSGCDESGVVAERQEREATKRRSLAVKHSPGEHYIVNMHSLHQPQLIRRIFDKDEYWETESETQRITLHSKLATQLRNPKPAKRKAADDGGGTRMADKAKKPKKNIPVEEEGDSDVELPSEIFARGKPFQLS